MNAISIDDGGIAGDRLFWLIRTFQKRCELVTTGHAYAKNDAKLDADIQLSLPVAGKTFRLSLHQQGGEEQ